MLEMTKVMRWSVGTSACCLALLISGCAQRQTGARLVYVASPPPATSAVPEPDSGTLVIEEPAKPELQELPLEGNRMPLPPSNSTPQVRKDQGSTRPAPAESQPEQEPLIEPPPLEPANVAGQGGLRENIVRTQDDVTQRLTQFERSRHSEAEGKTLDEAKAFLTQSKAALGEGDLSRAKNLADKARLLITALDKGQGH
jgi:hypothetical protein